MIMLRLKLNNLLLILASTTVLLLLTYRLHLCNILHERLVMDGDKHLIQYDRNMSVIIVGDVYRSGAGLLRAILNAHSEVRCDKEFFVNSWVFNMMGVTTQKEKNRLDEAGISKNVSDAAVAAFFLETLALGGEPARRLCTHSNFMLRSADHVSQILPQAKFIFVVRDGRAVVHSVIANGLMLKDFKDYNILDSRETLMAWNNSVSLIYNQCMLVGRRRCMLIQYEQLVLQPESTLKRILSFLKIPWEESVLHHETKYRGGFLFRKYINSDPAEGPINADGLTKWVGQFPLDVVLDMDTIAPMLVTLGYDPTANPPNYATPDEILLYHIS